MCSSIVVTVTFLTKVGDGNEAYFPVIPRVSKAFWRCENSWRHKAIWLRFRTRIYENNTACHILLSILFSFFFKFVPILGFCIIYYPPIKTFKFGEHLRVCQIWTFWFVAGRLCKIKNGSKNVTSCMRGVSCLKIHLFKVLRCKFQFLHHIFFSTRVLLSSK
jgi:hypothetical protein